MNEPIIWLNDGEPEGIADCGCRLVRDYNSGGSAFFMCEKHADNDSTRLLKQAQAALLHAQFRLNEVSYGYADTDFKGIRQALDALEFRVGPAPDRCARKASY